MAIDISIIIPLYNKEEYIERVLKCIENQTFKNWECIIVDDGSTDDSASIVKEYILNRGKQWRYFHQENRGQASARNTGIDLCEGRYIAFLDADDLWPNNKLALQFSALEVNPNCVLALSPFVIFDPNSRLPRLVKHTNSEKMLRGWLSMRGFGGGIESVGLIRGSALGTQLRFDESLTTSSGLDLTLRLAKLGEITFLREIGLFYRISEGQWHSNSSELERNMKIIRFKHQIDSGEPLDKYHFAYKYWSAKKSSGSQTFFPALWRSVFSTNDGRLHMIFCLIIRNLKARALGVLNYKNIMKLISYNN
jgi:glycosyltransferase involved in cell wall biosynthesis